MPKIGNKIGVQCVQDSLSTYCTTLNVLDTINSFNGIWGCGNGNYLYGYGVTNFTDVLRKLETGQAVETRGAVTSVDAGFTINRIYSTSTPDLIFILAKTVAGNYYLLKSADGGTTFANVLTFGAGNGVEGADSINVRILKNILELSDGTLLVAEYNVNGSRTAGSTNDRVRIMKSVDNGDNWTKLVEWNTNGSNQIGHIHAILQDTYTNEVYVCTGDVNNKASIIKWDGVSAWQDNKTPTEINAIAGFQVLTGSQRHRTCEVLFDENYFYTFSDTQTPNNPTGSESGIWRGKKDFSSFERVDNQIYDYDPMHIGWFGGKIGNTFIFTTSREYIDADNAWKELNVKVYVSTDGINWSASNQINLRDAGDPTAGCYINNVFVHNNKFYVDCVAGAGHQPTIQCDLSGRRRTYEDSIILHPVYFVGTWNAIGSDSNYGQNPDAPKLTLNNILISNRICAGARVKISSGNFSEINMYPIWSAATLQGRGSVVIEGRGKDNTHIIRSSGSGNTYGIYLEAARTLTSTTVPLIFKDLEFYISVDGVANHFNYVLQNVDSYIKTVNCKIGGLLNDDSPLINLGVNTKFEAINSYFTHCLADSVYKNIYTHNNGCTIIFKNCILLNANNPLSSNRTGELLTVLNCTFSNIKSWGISFGAAYNTQPVIKNNIFLCENGCISDISGQVETGIDYNLYNKANSNITDGGHSLAVGTDPLFVDAENGDFNLKSNSPCRRKGVYISTLLYDIVNRNRRNPPAIGAYDR